MICEIALSLWTDDLEMVCSFTYAMYIIIGDKFKINFNLM